MAAAVGLAVLAGAAGAIGGVAVLLVLVVGGLFVVVAARPALAVFLYIAAVPFISGIDRGALLPGVRPQEALQCFLMAAVATGWLVRWARGDTTLIRINSLDRALIGLALVGSVWALASALARGVALTGEDVAACAQFLRYLGLYALVRVALRTEREVRMVLWAVLVGAALLAVIALLQSLGRFGVDGLLSRWYETDTSTQFDGRGSATLGNPIAVGDYLAYSIALLVVWYERRPEMRVVLGVIGLVLAAGLIGTGQFSAWIAAVIVAVALAARHPQRIRLLGRALVVAALAVAVGWPVLARRLLDFSSGGLPVSWIVRLDNLRTFYLPHLAGTGFIFGVRPNTVLVAPETWRDQIFLESGYLALLWVGGIPLLIAFVVFVVRALRTTGRVALARADDVGSAATAAWVALWVLVILSVLDIHVTLRGGADLLFVLLGIATNRLVRADAPLSEEEVAA
jgi:hypothetical protein